MLGEVEGELIEQIVVSDLIYGRIVKSLIIVISLLEVDFGGIYIV